MSASKRTGTGGGASGRPSEILDAAAGLFAESGYRGTSIAAVAERVGITDAGVLYHFRTKEELLLGVLQSYAAAVEAGLAAVGVEGIDLLRLVREWGAEMERRPEISMLLIVLTTEYLTGEAPARHAIQVAYDRILDRYVTAFAVAAAAGDLVPSLDPVVEARGLVAHLDGIRLQWFMADRSFSMADSVRHYVDGVLTRLAPG